MNGMKPTGRADFETVAAVMLDLATVQYMHRAKLKPQLIVLGYDPAAPKEGGAVYRFGVVEVHTCFSPDAKPYGRQVLQQLIKQLLDRQDVLTVGLALEGVVTPIRNEAESDEAFAEEAAPSECLFLSMFANDCQGVKLCPITRTERGASFAEAEVVLGSGYFDADGFSDEPVH